MLPIGDHNPTRTTPIVNYGLLGLIAAVFVWQAVLVGPAGDAWLVPGYGLVPTRWMNDPVGEAFTLATSMFLHGGWGHLIGNLLYLYIFGDNVEDATGHARYLVFYFVCGIAAGLVQVAMGPYSTVPMVGASGAIAGVLGGYMVLYPRAPITLWVFVAFIELPAWLVAGLWFVWNLWSGVGQLGNADAGGVAFFAHVGGFLAGMLLIKGALVGRTVTPMPTWNGLRRGSSRSPARWSTRERPLDVRRR